MKTREFRFERKKEKTQIWKIAQHGESYTTLHGVVGGVMQENTDKPGPKGKEGTKGYVDAVANCKFNVDREVRKKLEHGYIEYVNGESVSEQITELDFQTTLPKNFCGYKPNPQNNMPDGWLVKTHNAGDARYTRKYDGMCHLAVHHPTGWEIYTRRMDLASERFPNHLKLLEETNFGPGTIIIAEAVCYDMNRPGKEDFKAISSFCRSLPEETRKIVAEGRVQEPSLIIFDVLFHNGKDLSETTYDERSKLWKRFPAADKRNSLLASIDYYKVTPETWEQHSTENDWEGFVVMSGKAVPGDKFYSFNGKAKRPKGHYKLKPIYEDDVVVFAGSTGTGKRMDSIGAFHIKQIHPETGKWFYCGKVGTGQTEADLEEALKLCKKLGLPVVENDKDAEKMKLDDKGFVVEIKYPERMTGTNKFRFPVFRRFRWDKGVDECISQRLAPEDDE